MIVNASTSFRQPKAATAFSFPVALLQGYMVVAAISFGVGKDRVFNDGVIATDIVAGTVYFQDYADDYFAGGSDYVGTPRAMFP